MFTIAQKELKILFCSPLAWVILALAQVVLAWVFLAHLDTFLQIQPQLIRIANPPGVTEMIVAPLSAMAAVVLLTATPLLTARLIAEERRNQTLTFLISAPVSISDIVLGKFLGLMIFFSTIIALVVALSVSLLLGGSLDFGLLLSNIAGLCLISACFTALGLYISCLSAQPATAGAGTLGVLLGLWVVDNVTAESTDGIARDLSLLAHYANFNRGMIDSFDLAYFAIFTLIFLVLSIRRLDGERLHG
ncbi:MULTISPECIES: ABC transporter permease [unclassified Nitrosospira]|uniref:ABC transporter permease n=1 Tax=unclassified Nitrosospira TaxID=2609267 RepID=UPI000D30B2AC|nr:MULTISPECIES: ABC transporter permease subunit [unclassified Nitrosospira]WON74806.1 ABC transporter permease subunit [Nitrosospira sp. Is2]